MALLPVTVVFLPPRRKAFLRCRASLPTTLRKPRRKAYIIADNRMAMDAGWDEELLRVEIESLQAADFDPLLTGFDEKELAKLFDDGIEAEEDDF